MDILIGLPEGGPRECDAAAREMLGGRGSSVFSVPCRDAVYAPDHETAREANDNADCGGLGSQSWGIVPRIGEVDVFFEEHEESKKTVFESHPEVCYREWSERELASKTGPDGIGDRLDVLEEVDTGFAEAIRGFVDERRDGNAAWHERIQSGRIDDVLDAAVLAMTAKHCHPSYGVLPADAAIDDIPVFVHPHS